MGDWSEAMEDGVICRGCALPFGPLNDAGFCPDCAPTAPKAPAPDASHVDRARHWKQSSNS